MKHLLLTTIAAVLLVGCANTPQSNSNNSKPLYKSAHEISNGVPVESGPPVTEYKNAEDFIIRKLKSPNKVKKTQKKRGPNPARWKEKIKAFEESDAKIPPPKGAVLWVGGSNARRWKDVNDHFPERQVINRGFGGARLSDIVHFVDRIILPYKPKTLLVNAGGNDLAGGKSPEQICETARALIVKVRKSLPNTRICFNGLPSTRPKAVDLHKLLAELARSEENIVFIDLAPAFTDDDGKRLEFFVKDGIHFNDKGYAVLAKLLSGKLPSLLSAQTSNGAKTGEELKAEGK